MDDSIISAELAELLAAPMVDWSDILDRFDTTSRNQLSSELSAMLERAARLKGYIEGKYMYAIRDHSFGVVASNKLAARIRKVLGFAYPQNDISF